MAGSRQAFECIAGIRPQTKNRPEPHVAPGLFVDFDLDGLLLQGNRDRHDYDHPVMIAFIVTPSLRFYAERNVIPVWWVEWRSLWDASLPLLYNSSNCSDLPLPLF